ncbi:WD40-repeat-containing domain protein [Boletus reticuloceps]|uniref:WD40-repeat-containing domain protein n=1 Tax=Boletus reticuloceps TaxID=495285 RepID=A0A8I2YUL7_9AGAM|nr:WD40-repeat-containing domain protein [Boletus reticuloceps]
MVESIEAHAEKITALDVSLDVSKIATGSRDGTMIIWCLETGRRIAGPLKQDRSVLSVRFSPAGDRLASAVSDYSIHVWSICNDACLSATRVPTTDPACSLAWSSDGYHLFAGCHRGSILCFDVSGLAQVVAKWNGRPHFDSVSTLCLSNNGKFIISASSSECSVKIWDVHTRSEITSLQHDSEVLDAEISSDDCHLVSGTKEGRIYIWNLRNLLPTSYFFHSLTACMIPSFHADSHPILTEIDNEAYVSWKKGELVSTEDILSSEIERSSTPSHYQLANRALVRARLQQWDGALDDAQASLSITPSLVARLAKSIAQSGQNRHDSGIEALMMYLKAVIKGRKTSST